MAHPTYSHDVLVCKHTKLSETDLILTLLASDGSQIKAVAKGARKPTSPFAARLELGSVCHGLFVMGKSLDIVKEVRLLQSNQALRTDYDSFLIASPVLELLAHISYQNLPCPNLYPAAVAVLDCMSKVIENPNESPLGLEGNGELKQQHAVAADPRQAVRSALCPASDEDLNHRYQQDVLCSLMCAFVFKALSYSGFKPSFDACVGCGSYEVIAEELAQGGYIRLSSIDGGVVCSHCASHYETVREQASVIQWCQYALYTRFATIVQQPLPHDVLEPVMRVVQAIVSAHVQVRLHSLEFLLQSWE